MDETQSNSAAPEEAGFLLGRLFVVPLIIVGVMVLCAVVVVLSFGAIASERQKPISQVLALLEASSGEKVGGMLLMPQDKEMWQAAQELALRLENLEAEVTPEQLPEIQSRLTKLLEDDLDSSGRQAGTGGQRLFFIMRAAARARAAQAVPVLIQALASPDFETRREALNALALMGELGQTQAQSAKIAGMLGDPEPVVRMMACVALSNLARPDDTEVIAALSDTHLADDDVDVRWNAALTLARLGSSNAVSTIEDMLKRPYWLNQRVRYQPPNDVAVDRPMTPNRVDGYLIAAIDAASNMDDRVIWDLIEDLTADPTLSVAARAKQALAGRPGAALEQRPTFAEPS